MQTVSETAIHDLGGAISGQVLVPSDSGYNDARALWNAMIDRRPEVIVRCATAEDVSRSVLFARSQGLPLSVKAGGHGVNGKALTEGGVTIDLGLMRDVAVDPVAKTARVGGGVLLGEFDAATQKFGLATTAGIATSTGVAGLALGGGLGLLMRRFGLTCDNLLEAEVVLADGSCVTASESGHPDLFWALRGGGGNFGVVTKFTFQLHEVGPVVFGGRIVFPGSDAESVFRTYRAFIATAPDELTVYATLSYPASGDFQCSYIVCYCGALEDAEPLIAPLRRAGNAIADTLRELPYVEMQAMFEPNFPYGYSHYWKSAYFDELSDRAITTLIEQAKANPSVSFDLEHMQGAVARVDAEATAFPDRTAMSTLIVASTWLDTADTERCMSEGRAAFAALEPFARRSVYINYMDREDEDRIREAFGGNYERLAQVKATYDPENVFNSTQNVVPAA